MRYFRQLDEWGAENDRRRREGLPLLPEPQLDPLPQQSAAGVSLDDEDNSPECSHEMAERELAIQKQHEARIGEFILAFFTFDCSKTN